MVLTVLSLVSAPVTFVRGLIDEAKPVSPELAQAEYDSALIAVRLRTIQDQYSRRETHAHTS